MGFIRPVMSLDNVTCSGRQFLPAYFGYIAPGFPKVGAFLETET